MELVQELIKKRFDNRVEAIKEILICRGEAVTSNKHVAQYFKENGLEVKEQEDWKESWQITLPSE